MCSVIGGTLRDAGDRRELVPRIKHLLLSSEERGRDSFGFAIQTVNPFTLTRGSELYRYKEGFNDHAKEAALNTLILSTPQKTFVGNFRGEPTTEWVEEKSDEDVQPFVSPDGTWFFSHNGTIANDKEILDGATPPTRIDSYAIGVALQRYGFIKTVREILKGSFALVAYKIGDDSLYYATNYKPMYALAVDAGVLVASQESYLLTGDDEGNLRSPKIQRIKPYTYGMFRSDGLYSSSTLLPKPAKRRTLVVCSGGLDSGVVAWHHHCMGDEVALFHLQYNAKAEGPEVEAVKALAAYMDVPAFFVRTDFFSEFASSALTDANVAINTSKGGEAGAEFAHEWVPARNTVLLALATAYAEKHGYNIVALGSNMEEGGAYPDNEMEFINRWRDMAPFAVGPYTSMDYADPCGPLVKHEIVELGAGQNMPFELTWSCYEGEEVFGTRPVKKYGSELTSTSELMHCGQCGPCAMRRKAFQMAGVEDPTFYAH